MTERTVTGGMPPKGRGCWYFHSVEVCVICGGVMHEYRERQWTPKPDDPAQRFEYRESAHAEHFL